MPESIRWPSIVLAYLTLLCLALVDNTRGSVFPNLIQDLDISSSRASMLFAIASFAALLTNVSARWWMPYISGYSSALYSLFFLLTGALVFSRVPLWGLWSLDLCSVFIGLGMGISNIGINLLIAQATPVHLRRRFFSGLHSIYGIGSFLAPLFLNFYLLLFANWNYFFLLLSIAPLMVFIFFLLKKKTYAINRVGKVEKMQPPCHLGLRFLVAFLFGFYVSSEIIVSSRLVAFLSDFDFISVTQSRYALSVFFLGLLAGRLGFTFFPIKGKSETLLVISILLSTVIYLSSLWLHPLVLSLVGLSLSYFFPVAMEWLSQLFREGLDYMIATAMTGVSVMLVIMHLGFGLLTDYFGVQLAMAVFPVLQLLCLIFIFSISRSTHQ